MFGALCKMTFPSKDDELGPGIDFDLVSLLLSPAGAAIGKYDPFCLVLKQISLVKFNVSVDSLSYLQIRYNLHNL